MAIIHLVGVYIEYDMMCNALVLLPTYKRCCFISSQARRKNKESVGIGYCTLLLTNSIVIWGRMPYMVKLDVYELYPYGCNSCGRLCQQHRRVQSGLHPQFMCVPTWFENVLSALIGNNVILKCFCVFLSQIL